MSAVAVAPRIGTASATCTISSGVVNAVTIVNAGFGFGKAPLVRFLGGGNAGNGSYLGLNQPGGASPSHPAQGLAVLSGGAHLAEGHDDLGGAPGG